jgi:hypothetical protein
MRKVLVAAFISLSLACATLQPGQDALLVRAEQVEQTSFAITNAFVTLEDQNQAALEAKLPGIHKAAEQVRRTAPPSSRALHTAIDAYRAAKVKDANTLSVALSVVEQIVADAQKWIAASAGGA